ncbi:hypothetical protein LWF15_28045 [Kineosporia rhizophila]|uniref:Lsr2 family DNA-binding protein n=1 Tax=Kineosporia rhizophila TaxID=84633 RepID=UPI001E299991|nr:hypothetical protein [Kineosporia rhizophila]
MWPADAQEVERIALRACTKRGAAIDIAADRAREHRSQIAGDAGGRLSGAQVDGDFVGSLTSGRLRYALAEIATLPRAAMVVEEPYSKVFAQERLRPALVADGLAEVQIAWPSIPIVFCDNRKMAEEWTYRWLAAARSWAENELEVPPEPAAGETEPSTKELRGWARAQGMDVPDRGRLRPELLVAWRAAQS